MIRQAISKRIINSIGNSTPQDNCQVGLKGFNHKKAQLVCRREIQILANLAARSFGCSPVRIRKDAPDNGLKEYAEYTVACMEQSIGITDDAIDAHAADTAVGETAICETAIGEKDPAVTADSEIEKKADVNVASNNSNTKQSMGNDLLCATLFRDAARLGRRIRRISGLSSTSDLEKLIFMLYRNIGITMTGKLPGEITVSKCYFSHYYTPEQCRVMSYVDSGIISGILGGGRLTFSQRITEGCACCKAICCEGRSREHEREDENNREYEREDENNREHE